jgi:hypothetical protein
MGEPELNLSKLFGSALEAMTAKREEVNAMDGYNGNHGDNMVENLRLITEALGAKEPQSPAEALKYASQQLQSKGQGGTSQYYAEGLSQAASQFQGRSGLAGGDVPSLVQTLMSAIPAEGHPQQAQAGGSVLDVLGLLGGQQAQAQPQSEDDGLDVGDVLEALMPAGLAFLQAKQSGADTKTAATQALMGALMGGRVNPFQANTPRTAAGGVIAQSLLQALTK